MSSKLDYPLVVGIHERAQGDWVNKVELGHKGPYSIASFTDTVVTPNPLNGGLRIAAFEAVDVVIQHSLLSPMTETVASAASASIINSSHKARFWSFDDMYHLTRIPFDTLMAQLYTGPEETRS